MRQRSSSEDNCHWLWIMQETLGRRNLPQMFCTWQGPSTVVFPSFFWGGGWRFETGFLYVSLAVLELLALVPQRSAASASPCRDQRHACPTTAQLRGFGFYLLSLGLIPYCTSWPGTRLYLAQAELMAFPLQLATFGARGLGSVSFCSLKGNRTILPCCLPPPTPLWCLGIWER